MNGQSRHPVGGVVAAPWATEDPLQNVLGGSGMDVNLP